MRSIVEEKSIAFAHRIMDCTDYIMAKHKKYSLCDQLFRSGTSIGANIAEAQYAQSPADFISKLSISQKECGETSYWLAIVQILLPVFEDASKLMVGDNDMLIYLWNSVDIVQHPSQDGILSNLQQWFWEVLSQLS